ncbi:MAG: hypothetical protein WC677_01445 [Clostridia bacterium]|jgi:tetratricopeptide (TPR) repeat protein
MISDDLNEYSDSKSKKFSLTRIEHTLNGKLIPIILISIVALLAYSNTFNAPFELDDFGSISNNYSIQTPFDFVAMWHFYSSRIVAYFTFSINYFFGQNSEVGYHVVNLIIHILSGFLFFLIFRIILGFEYFKNKSLQKYKNIICLLSAVIFIVHPINTSAVTYIVQRIASLAAMFILLSIYFYLKYRTTNKLIYFFLSFLSTIIAMFTKENSITIPILIITVEILFLLKEFRLKPLKRIAILFILSLTIFIVPVTNLYLDGYNQSDPNTTFKASTSMDRFHYLTTEINVVSRYVEQMLIPDRQNFDYADSFPKSKTIFENNTYISLIVIFLTLLMAILCIRRNKLISLGIFWFYIGLSVESTLISIKDVYFEHRLYFSSVGFVIFLVGIIFAAFRIFRRHFSFEKPLLFFLVFCIFTIPLYSGLTLKRNYLFSSDILLWSDVVSKSPSSDRAHTSLGTGYLNSYNNAGVNQNKYLRHAEKQFNKAISINPENSVASSNLSKVYLLQKRYRECINQATYTLALVETTYAYHNLGSAYENTGKNKLALEAYLNGYRIDNRKLFILEDVGNLYFKLGNYKMARFYYNKYYKYKKYEDSSVIDQKMAYIKKHL